MKQKVKEHLWALSGIIAAGIGLYISFNIFWKNGLFYVGVMTVVIMSVIMLLLGFLSWIISKNHNQAKAHLITDNPLENKEVRVYKKHWIEIATVLLVIIVFLGYIILHVTSSGKFSSVKLTSIAFPAFVLCQFLELSIILRSLYLIKNFMQVYPVIIDITALDKLKPIVSQCMIMALVFIVLLIISMILAAVIFTNWGIFYGTVTAISLTSMSLILKWYSPYENNLKQIKSIDPLLEPELNAILQSWHNDALPKF